MQGQDRAGPASWAGHQRGRDSSDSRFGVHFDEERQPASADPAFLQPQDAQSQRHESQQSQQELRRRRSSIAERVHSLRSAGGLNSFDNFARSWQRAAGFFEVVPVRQSFRFTDGEDGEHSQYERGEISPATQRSLLREQLEREEGGLPHHAIEDTEDDDLRPAQRRSPTPSRPGRTASQEPGADERSPLLHHRPSRTQDEGIFNIEPQLASPFGGSYGSGRGSLTSRLNEPSMRHAGKLFRQQQMHGTSEPDKELEPLLVKPVQDDDGKIVNVVVGQSTVPQTIFNSVNVLVGVGLLALPLAMRYAGWLPGILFLVYAALTTSYTAKLLAKCADTDASLITFADLAWASFGWGARVVTSILFSLELVGACVALIVLFADSLNALIPGYGLIAWKIICGIILLPLAFVPLRMLSFSSILGIFCTFGITIAVLVDGLVKKHQPGSLREPATTYLFPANWMTLPISFGLLMSPWGGHSVFPNIYRDMRHPTRYHSAVNTTYIFTFLLDTLMALVGYLMFGDGIMDEVTKNIVGTQDGYPHWISLFIVIAIAIIPITKVPLNARPIVSTLEVALGLDARAIASPEPLTGLSGLSRGILKITIRVACTIIFVILAIAVPDFDRIMSLIGAVACFTICIILPCAFHLKLFYKDLPRWQIALDWTLIVVSSVLALVSTAFNFVPKDVLGIASSGDLGGKRALVHNAASMSGF